MARLLWLQLASNRLLFSFSVFRVVAQGWLTLSGFVASYEWILQHLTDDSAAEQVQPHRSDISSLTAYILTTHPRAEYQAFAKDLQAYGYTYARFKQN